MDKKFTISSLIHWILLSNLAFVQDHFLGESDIHERDESTEFEDLGVQPLPCIMIF